MPCFACLGLGVPGLRGEIHGLGWVGLFFGHCHKAGTAWVGFCSWGSG